MESRTSPAADLQAALRLNQQGEDLFHQHNFDGAIAAYNKALESAPGLVNAQINLGVARLYQGNWAAALIHFAKAGSISPYDEDLAHNCKYVMAQLGGDHRDSLAKVAPNLSPAQLESALNDLAIIALVAELHRAEEPPKATPAPVNKAFLAKQREFWNVADLREAKFSRIVADPTIAAMPAAEQDRIWNESTDRGVARILHDIPAKPNWAILDVGCGIGRIIKPLRSRFARVDGVDIAEKMARMSQDYLSDGPQNGRILLNSGSDLRGLADNSYDLVFSVLTFQHIRSASVVSSYLREIIRVLKVGGWFRMQVLDRFTPRLGRADEEADPDRQYGFFGNGYGRDDLMALLKSHNFRDMTVVTENQWHWGTGRKG